MSNLNGSDVNVSASSGMKSEGPTSPVQKSVVAVVRRKYFAVLAGLIAALLIVQSALEMAFAFGENKHRIAEIQLASAWAASARIESYVDAIERQLRDVNALPWS